MNIIEAFTLLHDGKKIYHKNSPNNIYQLIYKSLKIYSKFDSDDFYYFSTIDGNKFPIDCNHDLEGWYERLRPIPISFNLAKEFYKEGKIIKRIGKDTKYIKNSSLKLMVSLEDIEANDWEVVE